MQRIHAVYSGHVQGVGFRFTSQRIANRLGLSGFVRNLPDGSVEVVCEGSDKQLERFLRELGEDMHGYIGDCQIVMEQAHGDLSSFDIRF